MVSMQNPMMEKQLHRKTQIHADLLLIYNGIFQVTAEIPFRRDQVICDYGFDNRRPGSG